MKRMSRLRTTLFVVGATVSGLVAAAGAAPPVIAGIPGVYTYPTDVGCTTTLQACVNQAVPGSTIHIATDTPIDEFVDFAKSLTIDAAPGFQPTISTISVEVAVETVQSPGASVQVTLDGLTLGFAKADFRNGTGHSYTLQDSEVDNTSTNGYAVELYTQVPADFTVERNTLRSRGDQAYTLSLITDLVAGPVTLRAIANHIDQKDTDDAGAGIGMQLRGTGSIDVDLMNNVIWDVGGSGAGDSGGIAVNANDTVDLDVNIVGNTLELSNGSGLDLRNDLVAGGAFAVDVFDNIISHHDFAGIIIDRAPGAPQFVWRAGYNDLFANGLNQLGGRPLGPGAMAVNPRFVDRATGDLMLRATSPLIDAGQVCTPGGVANPDAAGRHRLFGPTADIGAYERGAPVPDGIVVVGDGSAEQFSGTNGRDILCGNGAGDFLEGLGAADYLDGGNGGDVIFGNNGGDLMFGRKGGDLMCARDGSGNDLVDGGPSTDRFRADGGDTLISVETPDSCLP